jgi:hypothetical protein
MLFVASLFPSTCPAGGAEANALKGMVNLDLLLLLAPLSAMQEAPRPRPQLKEKWLQSPAKIVAPALHTPHFGSGAKLTFIANIKQTTDCCTCREAIHHHIQWALPTPVLWDAT